MMKGDETADGASLVETDPSQPNQQEPTAIKSPTINKNTLSFRAPSRNAPENTVGSPSQPMPYTMAIPASGFYPYAPAYSPMSPSPIDIYGQPYHAMASNGTPGGWYNYSPLPVYHLPNGMVSPAIGPHAGMVYLHPAYAEQLIGVPPSQSMPSTAVNATRNYPINNDENIDYCSNDDGDELGAGNEADDEAESMEPQQSPVYDNTGRFNGAGNGNFTSSNGDGSVGYAKAHGARIRDKNNHMSRRNLYIRNLPKSMTDAILFELSSRFGRVISAKAMMDSRQGVCKGYGFAMFCSDAEAANALVGLNDVGYQVSYAKESLASQLKRLQDNRTTNIYLSNLPVSMDESELIRICEEACDGGKVMSTRILRTEDGVSRGVGFARMDNRNNALLVIERLNGAIISGSDTALQLRFADSDSQKRLKTTIAVPRRQAMESNVIYDHIPTTPLHIDAASCSSAAYQPEHEDQKSTKSGPSPPYSSAVDSLASGMANAQIK